MTVLSLASTGAGFLLQVFLAAAFGVDAVTDAYLAATTIPMLANTVFLMAMNITFIPVFIEYETKVSREEAWRVAASFMAVVLVVLAAASLAGGILSEPLIRLVAPGLARDASTLALAVQLQRVLLPAIVFMAWGGLLAGLFYAQQSFVVPSLGPLVANLVALAAAWLLARPAGIYGLAIGVLAGNICQVLFFLIWLRPQLSFALRFEFSHPGVRQIGRLMLPWLLGAMIYKANPVIDRFIASQFPAGAISVLGYAFLLAQVAVLASSRGASLSIFPTISQLLHSGQRDQLPAVIDLGLRLILMAVVPVSVLILLLGETIVVVTLQRGAFSAADARLTALALAAYTGSIIALSLGNVLTYVYYALQDTRTPAVVGSVGMGLNLALALLLQRSVGFLAPAVSFSVMALFNLVVLIAVLRRRLGRLVQPEFFAFAGKVSLAGLGMGGVIWLTRQSATLIPAVAHWPPLLQLAYHGLGGGLAYGLLLAVTNRALVGQAIQQLAYRMSS